ncbi:MAG TPA: M23 family metallopeptidase [Candidatus Methylomirabilis sp.]|nr:M23 family metallopeptidase [Candidatus Methylomirabilis sp.]
MDRVIDGAIQQGQSLAEALGAHGISARLTHEIAQALRPHVKFRNIRPGATFEATLDETGALRHFLYRASPLEVYEVTREEAEYRVKRHEVPIERRVEHIAGTITSSLFESIEALGEKPEVAMRFVDIFVWDFDWSSHAQPGDRFRMLVEKTYSGATFVRYGKILVAEYENRGKTYTGIYFETGHGRGDFYTPDGRSVRKTFLRSPLTYSRISSGYTHHRHHPILGGVRPHLAIDYAAPHGTPVRAVADGAVLSAGWNGGNGKSVLIQHRGGYRTMYNHLSTIPPGIRNGTRVQQKQVIGTVGSTGLSTGPHLDYRVIKDGHFVNPLIQKFIQGDPIPSSKQAAFRSLSDRLLQEVRSPTLAITTRDTD